MYSHQLASCSSSPCRLAVPTVVAVPGAGAAGGFAGVAVVNCGVYAAAAVAVKAGDADAIVAAGMD